MRFIAAFLAASLVTSQALAEPEAPFDSRPTHSVVFRQSISAIESADFNADGLPDVVIQTGGDNELYVLLGKAGGTLGEPTILEQPRNYSARGMQIGDANGDGHLDIVTGYRTDIATFLGDGLGNFITQYSYRVGQFDSLDRMDASGLGLGDLNGDGRDDVIAIGHPKQPAVTVSLANADGTYQRPQPFTSERPFGGYPAFTVTDINRDGRSDVVAAYSSWLVAFTGNGDGTLNAEQGIRRLSNTGDPIQIRNGDNGTLYSIDTDEDGFADRLRLINRSSMFEYSIHQGQALFAKSSEQYYGRHGHAAESVDLDGDGVMDFVLGHAVPDQSGIYAPGVAIGWGSKTELSVEMPPILQQVPRGLAHIVDLDVDGKLDAIVGIKYPSDIPRERSTDTGPGFVHVFRGRVSKADASSQAKPTTSKATKTHSEAALVTEPSPVHSSPTPQPPTDDTRPDPADALVGCWNWSNGATISLRANGEADNGMAEGSWEALGNRHYRIVWADIVSSVTLDETGRNMAEKTMFSSGTGKRVGTPSGSFEGTWQLHNGATAVAAADGSYSIAHLKGSWREVAGERRYEILWPLVDTIALDSSGKRLGGSNQFGQITASRIGDCER